MNLNLPFLRIPDALLEGLKTVVFARGSKPQMPRLPSFRNVVVASSSRHTIRGRARNRLSEQRWLEHLVDVDMAVDVAVDVDVAMAVAAASGNKAYWFDVWPGLHDIHYFREAFGGIFVNSPVGLIIIALL
jgi:hypothetical protein